METGGMLLELDRLARALGGDCCEEEAVLRLLESAPAVLGVDGAAVSLVRSDGLVLARAEPSVAHTLAEHELRQARGPMTESCRTGRPVLLGDVAEDGGRWTDLTTAARRRGIRAIAAVAVRLDGEPLGALGLYRSAPRRWTDGTLYAAELMALLLAGHLAHAERLRRSDQTVVQLQQALESRVVIEQAKGVLAGELGISVDQAFDLLRAHARSHHVTLRHVAHAVVDLGMRL